ncbi:hypothetical protein [Virgibacillus pantothenticus]|uniref:hypothetical protein n=1 Tax=Virgibacillus pantothenticus TaxID=1473 RepID=UPI0025AF1C89|nr:hypothetical protein [Virgibacillus pantothenticus]
MTQYYYISSPHKLPKGTFGSQPVSEKQPNIFNNELDAIELIFEDNYDSKTKKRFKYVPILSFKYQVAVYNNFLPIKNQEIGNSFEEKCLHLLYEYLHTALHESGILEFCTCLNGTEEQGNWTKKILYWSDIKSPYDLVLNDREICEMLI